MAVTTTRQKKKSVAKPTRSVRTPQPLLDLIQWLSANGRLGEKPSEVYIDSLWLGARIKALCAEPGPDDRYDIFTGEDLAEHVVGNLRRAARVCELFGFPVVEGPGEVLDRLKHLEGQLKRVEEMLTDLSQGGHVTLADVLAAIDDRGITGLRMPEKAVPATTNHVESIGSSPAAAKRLNLKSGIVI